MNDYEHIIRNRSRRAAERRQALWAVIALTLTLCALYIGMGFALDNPANSQRQEVCK